MQDVWAILPVKRLAETKSRLTEVLSPDARAELTRALLTRTLRILAESGVITGTLVVSQDWQIKLLAQRMGAVTTAEAEGAGLNSAVTLGAQIVCAMQTDRLLVLPSDLPFVTPEEIRAIVDCGVEKTAVIAGDEPQQGTNALLLPPTVPFTYQYGPESFQAHWTEILRHGLQPRELASPGLQFDLDTAADWRKMHGLYSSGFSRVAYRCESG